jgi:hypothetical protein
MRELKKNSQRYNELKINKFLDHSKVKETSSTVPNNRIFGKCSTL